MDLNHRSERRCEATRSRFQREAGSLLSLSTSGGADDEFFAAVDAEAEQVAEHLREGCLAMPDPDVLDIFGLVYGEQTEELATQREQFASYLASFEPSHGRSHEGVPA